MRNAAAKWKCSHEKLIVRYPKVCVILLISTVTVSAAALLTRKEAANDELAALAGRIKTRFGVQVHFNYDREEERTDGQIDLYPVTVTS